MEFKYVTSGEMSKVDALAVRKGLKIEMMMENAGRNLARFIMNKLKPKKVIILFGRGNNGGGGLVAARHLGIYGLDVQIVAADKKVNDNVRAQLKILKGMGIIPRRNFKAKKNDVIIDALLGYNIKGNPRGKYKDLISGINFMRRARVKVVSLDLPSGLNPDTGERYNPCVEADYVLTLALPKKGLQEFRNVYLANIGIPDKVYLGVLGKNPESYFSKSDIVKIK